VVGWLDECWRSRVDAVLCRVLHESGAVTDACVSEATVYPFAAGRRADQLALELQ
jgi:hypothetical protein